MGDAKKMLQVRSARQVPTRILLLDDEFLDVGVDKRAVGGRLFDIVCDHLNILEKDYFGLNYRDPAGIKYWLNNDKKISKQMKGQNWEFTFEVKFYPADPTQLAEDLTRYQLCLQIRRDVVNERVPCSFVTYTLLGSYTAQSEMGDYDTEEFGSGYKYLKDIKFAPKQDRELLMKIAELHRQHKGQTPEESEQHFLENAKKLAMYGIELHNARDAEGKEITIGVGASGITIYKDKMQVNRFVWPKVLKISYRRHKFYIKIRPGEFETFASLIGFRLENVKMAKRLWKICVEHHSFFRFREPEEPKSVSIFPRFGSRFRYSGLTQFQSRQLVVEENRDCPSFDRVLSKRGTFGGRTPNQRKRDEERHQRRQDVKRAPLTSPRQTEVMSPRQTEVPPPIPASMPPLPASEPPQPKSRTPPEPKHAPPIAPKPKLRGSRDNLSVDRDPPASLNDSFEDVPDRRSKMEKMHAVATPLAAVLKQKSIDMEKERDKHHLESDKHHLESDSSSRGPPGYTSDDPDERHNHHREVGKFSESRGSLTGAGRLETNISKGRRERARFRKSDLESEGSDSARYGQFEGGNEQAKINKDTLTAGKGKHDDSGIYLFSYPSSSIDSILSTDFADYEAETNMPEKWQKGTGSEENLYLSGFQQKERGRNSHRGLKSHYSAENISSASSSDNCPYTSHADGIYAEIDDVKTQVNRLEGSKQIDSHKTEFSRTKIQSEPIRGRRSKLYTKNQKSKPTATVSPVPVQAELEDVAIKSVLTTSNTKMKDSKLATSHYAQIHKMSDKLKQFLKEKPKTPNKTNKSKHINSKECVSSNKSKHGGSKESVNTTDEHIVIESDNSSFLEDVDPESRTKLREELKMYILNPENLSNRSNSSQESQLKTETGKQNQFGKSFTVEAELHKEHSHDSSYDIDEQNDMYMQMTNVRTLPTRPEMGEENSALKPLNINDNGTDSSDAEQPSYSSVQQPDLMKRTHSYPEKLSQNVIEEQEISEDANNFGQCHDSMNEVSSITKYEHQTVSPEMTETVDNYADITKSRQKGTETEKSAHRIKGKKGSDVIQSDEERQVRFKLPDAEDTVVQNARMPTETEINIDPLSEMLMYDEEPGSNRRYRKGEALPMACPSLSNNKEKVITIHASKQFDDDGAHCIEPSEDKTDSKPISQNFYDHVYENLPQDGSSSNLDVDNKSESEYVEPDQFSRSPFFNASPVDSLKLDTSLDNSSIGSTRQRLEDTSLSSLYQLTFDGSSLGSPDQSLSRDSIGYSDIRSSPVFQRSLEDQDLERFCTLSSSSSDIDDGMLMEKLDRDLEKVCPLSTDSSDVEQDIPSNRSNNDYLKAIQTDTSTIQTNTSRNVWDVSIKNVSKESPKSDYIDAVEHINIHCDDTRSKNSQLTTKQFLKEDIDENVKDVSIPYKEQSAGMPTNDSQSSQNNLNIIPVKGIQDNESEKYEISVKPTSSRRTRRNKQTFDCEVYAEEPYSRRPGPNQSIVSDDRRPGPNQPIVGVDRGPGPNQSIVRDDRRPGPNQPIVGVDRGPGPNQSIVRDDRRPGPKQSIVSDDRRPGPKQSIVIDDRGPGPNQSIVSDDRRPGPNQSIVRDDMKENFQVDESQINVGSQPLISEEVQKINDEHNESQWREQADNSVVPNCSKSDLSEDHDKYNLISGEPTQVEIEPVGTNEPIKNTGLQQPTMSKDSHTVPKRMDIVEEMRKARIASGEESTSLSSSNSHRYHKHPPYHHKEDSDKIPPKPHKPFTKTAEAGKAAAKAKSDRSQVHLPTIGANVFDRITNKLTITDGAIHSCKNNDQKDVARKSSVYSPRIDSKVMPKKYSRNDTHVRTDSETSHSDSKHKEQTEKVPFKRNPIRTVAIIEGSKVFREDERNPSPDEPTNNSELMPDKILSGNIKYFQGSPIVSKPASADIKYSSFSDDNSLETSSLSGTCGSQQSMLEHRPKSKQLSRPREGKKMSPGVIHMINPCQVGWIEGGLQSSPKRSRKPTQKQSNNAVSCLDFEPEFVDMPGNKGDRMDVPISCLDFDLTSKADRVDTGEELEVGDFTCGDAGVIEKSDSDNEIEVSPEVLTTAPASDLLCKRVWTYTRKGQRDDKAIETNDDDTDDEFDKAINKGPYFLSENQDGANNDRDISNASVNERNLDSNTSSSMYGNSSSPSMLGMSGCAEEQQFVHNVSSCDRKETMIPVDQRDKVHHKDHSLYSEKNIQENKSNIICTPCSVANAEEIVVNTDLDARIDGFGLRNPGSVELVDGEELSQSSTDSESEGEEIISFEMPTQKHETESDDSSELHNDTLGKDGSRNGKCSMDGGVCTNAELLDDSFAIDCSFENIKSYRYDNEDNESNVQKNSIDCDSEKHVLTTDLDEDDPDDDFDIFAEDSDYDEYDYDGNAWFFPVPEVIEEEPCKPTQSILKYQQKKETSLFERRVHFQKDLPVYKSLKNIQTLDVRDEYCDAMPSELDKDKMEYFENFITCLFDKEPRNLGLGNQMDINDDSERDRGEDIITSNRKRLLNQRRKLVNASREDTAESEGLWYFNSEILQEDVFAEDEENTAQASGETPESESDSETLQEDMFEGNESISTPEIDVDEAKTSFGVPDPEFGVEHPETPSEEHLSEIKMKHVQEDIVSQKDNDNEQITPKQQYDRPIYYHSGFEVLREPLSKSTNSPRLHHETGYKRGIPQIAKPITGRRQKQCSNSNTTDVRPPKTNYPIEAKVELEDTYGKMQPKYMSTMFSENCAVDSKTHDEHLCSKQDDAAAQNYVHLHSVSKSSPSKVFNGSENVKINCSEKDFEEKKLEKDFNSERKPGTSHKYSPERTKYTYAMTDESDPDSPKIKYVTYEYITEYKLDNVKIHYQRNQIVQTEAGDNTETLAKVEFPSTDANADNLKKRNGSDISTSTETDHICNKETEKGTKIEVEAIIEKSVCYPLGPINSLPIVCPDHLGNDVEIEEHIEKSVCHKLGSRREDVEAEDNETGDPDENEAEESMEKLETVETSSDLADLLVDKPIAKFDVPMLLINGYGGGNNNPQKQNTDSSQDGTVQHHSSTKEKSLSSGVEVISPTVGSQAGSVKSVVKGHNAKQIIEHNSQRYVWQSFEPDTTTSLHKKRIEFGNNAKLLHRRWTIEGSGKDIPTSSISKLRDKSEESTKTGQSDCVSEGQTFNKDIAIERAEYNDNILDEDKATACETVQDCDSAQSMDMHVDQQDGSMDMNIDRRAGGMYCAVMQEELPALQIEEMTQETLYVVQAMAVVALGAVLVFLLPYMG